jgi:hypothetical protein
MPSAVPGLSAKDRKREAEYQAEDDHRTLTRAEEVRADPKRMTGVRRHHQKQTRALSRISKALGGARAMTRGGAARGSSRR